MSGPVRESGSGPEPGPEPAGGPPRLAVVGPGAIGLAFAAAVQQAGRADLELCGRRPLPAMTVTQPGPDPETVTITAPLRTDPATITGTADVVLLAVKAYQTAGAAGWLARLCGPGTVVAVLQNGVEQVATVTPLAGGATVLPSTVWCPAEAVAPGQVVIRARPRLGLPAGPAGAAVARLLDGPARIDLVEDFTTEAWRKLVLNAMAGLMALAGRRAGMFRDPDVAALATDLGRECAAVGRAEGARLPDSIAEDTLAQFTAMPPDLGTSILYDRQAGRPLEWDARNGVIRRLGARHGVPTPVSDVITPLLAAASGD